MPTDKESLKWKQIKAELDAGKTVMEVCKSGRWNVTPAQIYGRRKSWDKTEYKTGKGKYEKFNTPEYKAWRAAVLARDGHRCIICGRGRKQVKVLQVDHILSWSRYPELRYTISNGRTLCVYHHKRTLNYGFKANNCDDSLNGKVWENKERVLWKLKELQLKKRVQTRLKGR